MRKRIWAVLLSVCLLVGLLPTTALAGGFEVTTYQELVDKLSELQSGYAYLVPAADFGWPEEATLTIPANVGIQVETGKAWEIPSGITVNFAQNCQGIRCDELTINGTMHMAYSSQDAVLRKCGKVIIGPTGTFTCADDRPDYPTVYGAYIPAGSIWEVQEGGTLNCGVRLDGTLTGSGTVSGTVSAQGGFSSTPSTGVLSGDLTLTGSLQIGQWNSGAYADSLTIPEGSQISFRPAQYGSITINTGAKLILDGQLDVSGSRSSLTTGLSIYDGGKMQMGAGSVLSMHYPYELSWSYDAPDYDAEVPDPSATLVTGSGTIEYHADQVAELVRFCLFSWDITGHDMPFETAYDELFPSYISNDITLWRSWACDHTWNDGEVTKEPTCTEPGEKTYTCTGEGCGETKTEEIPAAGHTYGADGICTACGASKSEAGTETCSITLHYDDALCDICVIDGNTQSSDNPTVFVSGNGQSASVASGSWAIFKITNIQDGYRIGSVTLNGTDRTEGFVNGAYGGLGISNISTDYALTAVMEEIPDTLPSVTHVTLYTDSAGTQPAAENITYTSESTKARLYGKATFSDDGEYPVYYARGQWQFSTDGTTWQDTERWGSNRFDFWPGWQYHEELDFLNASYDIRLKVNPQDLYTTGSSVYSNVIHINGGAEAAPTDPEPPTTDVVLYVNGVDMANGGTVDGAVYTAATNTLTLTGAEITNYYTTTGTLDGEETDIRAGIYYSGAETLNIVLADSSQNTITLHPSRSGDTEYGSYVAAVGIYADGNVEITAPNFAQLMFENDTISEDDAIFETKEEVAYVYARPVHATDSLTISGRARVDASVGSFRIDPSVTLYGWVYNSATNVSAANVYVGKTMHVTGVYPQFYSNSTQADGTLVMDSGIATIATFRGGDVSLVKGKLTINSFTANDISMSGGMLTAKKIAAHDLAVTGGELNTEPSTDTTSKLTGMILLSGSARFSGGTITVNSSDTAGIRSDVDDSYLFTKGDCVVSSDTVVNITVSRPYGNASGISMGGRFQASGNARVTVNTGTDDEANLGEAIAANLGASISDSAVVDLTGGYFALSVGNSISSGDFVMTGGTLNATPTADTGATVGIFLWGNLAISGGSVTTRGDYGIELINADADGFGNFAVTGGMVKATGTKAAVCWKGSEGLPSITENVTVSTAPANIKFLAGSVEYEDNGYTYKEYYAAYARLHEGPAKAV